MRQPMVHDHGRKHCALRCVVCPCLTPQDKHDSKILLQILQEQETMLTLLWHLDHRNARSCDISHGLVCHVTA